MVPKVRYFGLEIFVGYIHTSIGRYRDSLSDETGTA